MQFTPQQKTEIASKALWQFRISHNSFSEKKDLFRERKYLYANIERDDAKINIHTTRGIIRTLLSLYYKDQLTVHFSGQNPYVWEAGEEWNNVAKHDYKKMDMEVRDYQNQLNRFTKWVWIRFIYDRDQQNSLVKFEVVNPESRRPDPKGWLTPNNFNYMWFDRTMPIDELKMRTNLEMNEEEIAAYLSDDERMKQYSDTYGRYITDQWDNKDQVTIYYHLMYFEVDKKTIPLMCSFLWTELLTAKPIEPLMQLLNDEKSMYNVKRPVSLNYRDPIEWDPFGGNVLDLTEDKQKLKNLMFNLMKIKAVKQALWGTLFVDSEIYKGNKSLLENPTKTTKIVPVTSMPDKWVAGSVMQLPEDRIGQDAYQLLNLIDWAIQDSTNISEQKRGLTPEKEMTKAEAMVNETNADTNLLLANRVNARGEKQFWELIYVYYKHYFDSSSKKYVEINRGYWSTGIYYTREQLFDIIDPAISISNKSTVESMNAREIQAFQITYLQDIQNPTIPEISKRYLHRKYKRLLANMTRNELDIIHPPSPEEMKAKRDLLLLNRNIPVKVRNMQESHIDYIITYWFGLPTPANRASTEARIKAYIASGQSQQIQQAGMEDWGNKGMANAMSNQLVANSLQTQQETVQQ